MEPSNVEPYKAFMKGVRVKAQRNRIAAGSSLPSAAVAPMVRPHAGTSPAPLQLRVERDDKTDGLLSFCRSHTLRKDWDRLRRGKTGIEATLDLHGLTVDQARRKLHRFIDHHSVCGSKCVCIIHGKGCHSTDGAVLKPHVAHWLKQVASILAYHSCQPRHGGQGAVCVLFKRRK